MMTTIYDFDAFHDGEFFHFCLLDEAGLIEVSAIAETYHDALASLRLWGQIYHFDLRAASELLRRYPEARNPAPSESVPISGLLDAAQYALGYIAALERQHGPEPSDARRQLELAISAELEKCNQLDT